MKLLMTAREGACVLQSSRGLITVYAGRPRTHVGCVVSESVSRWRLDVLVLATVEGETRWELGLNDLVGEARRGLGLNGLVFGCASLVHQVRVDSEHPGCFPGCSPGCLHVAIPTKYNHTDSAGAAPHLCQQPRYDHCFT